MVIEVRSKDLAIDKAEMRGELVPSVHDHPQVQGVVSLVRLS